MVAAVVAMTVMIVVVDQLFWRPLVAWAERFKLEDVGGASVNTSWVLKLLRRSQLYAAIQRFFERRQRAGRGAANGPPARAGAGEARAARRAAPSSSRWWWRCWPLCGGVRSGGP